MGLGKCKGGRHQAITPRKGSWAESLSFEKHMAHAKKVGISTPCTANHVAIGGGCLNCGWKR